MSRTKNQCPRCGSNLAPTSAIYIGEFPIRSEECCSCKHLFTCGLLVGSPSRELTDEMRANRRAALLKDAVETERRGRQLIELAATKRKEAMDYAVSSAEDEAQEAARVADDAIYESVRTGRPVVRSYSTQLSDHLRISYGASWSPTKAHTVIFSGVMEGHRWTVQLVPEDAP